jgi:hypothetical protein
MKKWWQGIGAGALLAGCLLAAGCTTYSGDIGYHDYDYYPDMNVYYYPPGQIYYWNENGHWRSGRELPASYKLAGHPHQNRRLQGEEPWHAHQPE